MVSSGELDATAVAGPREEPEVESARTETASVGTPILVWIVYILGSIAAVVLAASVVFVVLAYATSGGGGFGVAVSVPSLVVCLALVAVALATYLWRRFEGRR